ncbi:MAG: hypothetical protein ACYCO5_07760, partial [Acidobacteriaceae bacterium]
MTILPPTHRKGGEGWGTLIDVVREAGHTATLRHMGKMHPTFGILIFKKVEGEDADTDSFWDLGLACDRCRRV